MNKTGQIELLLLLCCVVGVVIFLCFSLSVVCLFPVEESMGENRDISQLSKEINILQNKKIKEENKLEELEDALAILEKLKEQIEKSLQRLVQNRQKLNESRSVREEELERLKNEYEMKKIKIEGIRKELAEMPVDFGIQKTKAQIEKNRLKLKSRLEKLNQEIKRMQVKLSELDIPDVDRASGKQEKQELMRRLKDIDDNLAKVKKEIKRAKVEVLWKGTTDIKKPLFLECKNRVVLYYPEKKAISISEIDDGNVFEKITKGHDGIVLFVRPDGFESFKKSYNKVQHMELKICYEPLDDDWDLSFLEKRSS